MDEQPTGSHPVKAKDITIAYPHAGRNAGHAVIHKTGCKHLATQNLEVGSRYPNGFEPLADDWPGGAPCTR